MWSRKVAHFSFFSLITIRLSDFRLAWILLSSINFTFSVASGRDVNWGSHPVISLYFHPWNFHFFIQGFHSPSHTRRVKVSKSFSQFFWHDRTSPIHFIIFSSQNLSQFASHVWKCVSLKWGFLLKKKSWIVELVVSSKKTTAWPL